MAYIGKIKDANSDVVYPQTKLDAIIDWGGTVHDWSREGMTLNSDFKVWNDGTGYRYWELPGGWKLVELLVKCQLNNASFSGGDWFTVPDFIAPNSRQLVTVVPGGAYTEITSSNTVGLFSQNGGTFEYANEPGYEYCAHFMYFTKEAN